MKKYLACATAVALSLTIGSLPASAQTVGGCSKDIMKNESKLISAIAKELGKIAGSYFKLAAKNPLGIPAGDLAGAAEKAQGSLDKLFAPSGKSALDKATLALEGLKAKGKCDDSTLLSLGMIPDLGELQNLWVKVSLAQAVQSAFDSSMQQTGSLLFALKQFGDTGSCPACLTYFEPTCKATAAVWGAGSGSTLVGALADVELDFEGAAAATSYCDLTKVGGTNEFLGITAGAAAQIPPIPISFEIVPGSLVIDAYACVTGARSQGAIVCASGAGLEAKVNYTVSADGDIDANGCTLSTDCAQADGAALGYLCAPPQPGGTRDTSETYEGATYCFGVEPAAEGDVINMSSSQISTAVGNIDPTDADYPTVVGADLVACTADDAAFVAGSETVNPPANTIFTTGTSTFAILDTDIPVGPRAIGTVSACTGGGNAYCSAVGTPVPSSVVTTNSGTDFAAGGDVCAAIWTAGPTAGTQVGGFVSIDGLLAGDSVNIVSLVND
jgi:hypothetical protein